MVIPGRFELPTPRLGGGLNSFFHLFFSTVLSAKTPYPCGFSSFLENNGHKAKLVYFSTYYTQFRFELAKSFAKFSRENHHMNPQYYSKVAIVSGKTNAHGFCFQRHACKGSVKHLMKSPVNSPFMGIGCCQNLQV